MDLITEGVVKKTGSAPFPDTSAPPPPPAETPDVMRSRIERPIERGTDEENVREATRQMREWEAGVGGPDPFEEQRAPILERRYDGRDTEAKSLKTTTKDLSDQHWVERPETEILRSQGWSDEQILKLGKNEDWLVKQIGYTPQQAAEYARRGEVPPLKVTAVRDDGRPVRPLDDDAPVTEADAFRSRSELKRGVRNFRQAAAEAQAQLLAELAAQQEPAVEEPARPAAVGQAVDQPVQAVEHPKPQQPDPVAVARAELAVERQIRNSSFEEQRAAAEIEKWVAWGQQNFPELQSVEAVEEVKRASPQRLAQLQQAAQRISQAVSSWMAHGSRATEQRVSREQQLATHHNALLQHTYREFSRMNDDAAAAKIPELQDSARAHALRTATKQMLKDVGFSDDEVTAAWSGKTGVPLRDYRVQMLLADGARWRMAQAKVNQVTKAPIPPVQRPGTYRPAGAGDMETVQRLQRELDSATGDRAVKLATRLHQARRAAGM
jgi:hypothetical protein